jgi:hypothetical protein
MSTSVKSLVIIALRGRMVRLEEDRGVRGRAGAADEGVYISIEHNADSPRKLPEIVDEWGTGMKKCLGWHRCRTAKEQMQKCACYVVCLEAPREGRNAGRKNCNTLLTPAPAPSVVLAALMC